jgi:beta-lactam-binding protein with PASTA domain
LINLHQESLTNQTIFLMETGMNRIKRVMTWVMLLSIFFFLMSSSDLIHAQSGHSVTVPDVSGKTEADARAAIEGAGLVYGGATEVLQRKVKQSEIGRVIGATYPTSAVVVEGELKPGTVVTVQIAGPPGVEVPNVIGKTEEAARTAIEGAGLVYGGATVGTDIPARPSDARRVRSIVVEGGNPDGYVRPGTTVSVVLLRSYAVQVPNVVGKTEADAKAAIEGAHLVYGGATIGPKRAHKLSDVGKAYAAVVGGGEADGEFVEPGTTVSVLLWAPITVKMPKVVGMTEEEARAAIEGAGLVYGGATEVLQKDVKPSQVGRVITATYPSSAVVVDGELKPGTVVTVQIAGPPGVEVPNVIGKTEEEARKAIEGAGLVYGGATVGTDIPARPSDARRVRSIVVEGGNPDGYVKPGTTVSVVLLRSYVVQVPSVVGMTEADAKAAIEQAHLVYGGSTVGTRRAPTAAESNRVYAAVVGGGFADEEYVEPGTTVSVVLWKPYGDEDRCQEIDASLTAAKDINTFRALVTEAQAENCDFYQKAYNYLLQWEQREERCNQIDASLVAASQAKDLNTFRVLVEQARIDNCNCYQGANDYLQRWDRCANIKSDLIAASQAQNINQFRALVEQARIDNCDSYQSASNYLRNWEQQIQRSATQPVFQPPVQPQPQPPAQPQPQPPQQTHPAGSPCRRVCVQEEVIWLNVSDGRHSLCAGGVPRSPGPGLPPPKCERRVRCIKWETICR